MDARALHTAPARRASTASSSYWRPRGPHPVLPPVVPARPPGPRAHPGRGPAAPRREPPVVPRPVRARDDDPAARCYYVAKKELFARPPGRVAPQRARRVPRRPRRRRPATMLDTARAILERGDCVLIFPEGTRVRPGGLGTPKRGVGRLALESGAPVVPLAVTGTEDIRRGWRIRPRRVTVRAGPRAHLPARSPSRRRSSRRRSPTASGRASRSSGSGSAASRRCAAPRSSVRARLPPRSRTRWSAPGSPSAARHATPTST